MTPDDMASMAESMKWNGSAVTTDAMPAANAAITAKPAPNATSKTFNITARQFAYSVSPSPFIVNQGDDVTLNISVPSNDGSSVGHGFFLESYMPGGAVSIDHAGSDTVHFVASIPGTFTYFCTVVCGSGHPGMNGILTVMATTQLPPPAVTSVSPASGPSAGGNSVTISGSGFQANATVLFGGSAATNVAVSDPATITAMAPAQPAGRVTVSVTNTDGQSASFDGYAYVAAPSIASISPTSAVVTGGTQLTITGSGFAAGATVRIGSASATNVAVVSSTTITATVPAGASAQIGVPQAVVVTNPDAQSATLAGALTYNTPLATACVADSKTACLLNNRFKATVRYRGGFDNSAADTDAIVKTVTGFASASFETAFFYFNSPNNIELLLKIIDQGNTNSSGQPTIAVLFGSATPLRAEVTITDTQTGLVKPYISQFGSQAGSTDFTAFVK
jgi:plastocyanin